MLDGDVAGGTRVICVGGEHLSFCGADHVAGVFLGDGVSVQFKSILVQIGWIGVDVYVEGAAGGGHSVSPMYRALAV